MLASDGFGTNVLKLNGGDETLIKFAAPNVSALLLAPWKAYFETPGAQPVPSPPAMLPVPQSELITFLPKVVNWVVRLFQ